MKLCTFAIDGERRVGAVDGDQVVNLSVAAPGLPTDMMTFLSAGEPALAVAGDAIVSGRGRMPLSDVRLAAPVLRPQKFLGIGLNYGAHVVESGREESDGEPTVFAKMPSCITGPYDDVERPAVSDSLDYEGELGVVIGRTCRHVARSEAPGVIAGYVVVNDFSVRDWQRATSQWTLSKSFDTHGPIGPWIVTTHELAEPHDLGIRTFVNGELRQSANTRELIHDCFAIVEHLAKACTLLPGDIVATGTPAGVGFHMRPPRALVPGDVVRVEIDRVGAIENRVVADPAGASAGERTPEGRA